MLPMQGVPLYARYLCSRDALGLKAAVGQARRATIGYLVYKVFHSTTSTPFTKTGYRNWKMALSKKSGFMKHASSENHQSAMAQWKEQQHRDSSYAAISTLLSKGVRECLITICIRVAVRSWLCYLRFRT